MTTENQRGAERLVKDVDEKYNRYLGNVDYYRNRQHWDETHADIITAALEAAEKRGREKAFDECFGAAKARREQWRNAGGFDGHATAALILMNEISALKVKP